MISKEVVINNQVGLHARPATFFIQKANEFKSSIWVEKDEEVQEQLTLTTDLYEKLEADMTEIPYLFTDDYDIYTYGARVYLNQSEEEIASWKKLGVQSIYYDVRLVTLATTVVDALYTKFLP